LTEHQAVLSWNGYKSSEMSNSMFFRATHLLSTCESDKIPNPAYRSNNMSTQHSCVYVYFKPEYMHPCIQTCIVPKYMLILQYIRPNIIRFSYTLNLNTWRSDKLLDSHPLGLEPYSLYMLPWAKEELKVKHVEETSRAYNTKKPVW
jgi:hypothetical protein